MLNIWDVHRFEFEGFSEFRARACLKLWDSPGHCGHSSLEPHNAIDLETRVINDAQSIS